MKSPSVHRCAKCGIPVDDTILGGECPACLMGVVSDPVDEEEISSGVPALDLPGYEILETLGQGGMGVVHLARQRSLDRLVAIKVIGRHLADNAEFRQRFLREARILAKIRHPNVLTIHDSGRTESGALFFVMKYVPGKNFAELLEEGSLPTAKQALAWFEAIGSAVSAVHGEGIVHRDLKPANVLLGEKGEIKVGDFGLAGDTGEVTGGSSQEGAAEESQIDAILPLTRPDAALGTPGYRAPEKETSQRSDIYSLGVMLRQLTNGVGDQNLMSRLRPVIERATADVPKKRQATVAELRAEVHRASRRPIWQMALAGLLVAGLIAGAWLAGQDPSSGDEIEARPLVGPVVVRGTLLNNLAADADLLNAVPDAVAVEVVPRGWLALRENGYLIGSRRWRRLPERAMSLGRTQRGFSGLFAIDHQSRAHFAQPREWGDVPFEATAKVRDLDAGERHGLTLHHDGSISVWGAAFGGEGSDRLRWQEPPDDWLRKVTQIAALRDQAFVLCEDGTIRGWGERGLRESVTIQSLRADERLVELAAGRRTLVLRTQAGRVIAWDVVMGDEEVIGLPDGQIAIAVEASWDCFAARLSNGQWHLWGEGWDAGIAAELKSAAPVGSLSFSGLRNEETGLPGTTVAAWVQPMKKK
jgi:predicted Ser/Thr protein kinase